MTVRHPKSVKNEMLFAAETHRRWMGRRNRRQEDPDYKSAFDGHVQFEHDGCNEFEPAETWIQPNE
jgi:hypothetical protein